MTLEEFTSVVEEYRVQISLYNHKTPHNIKEIHAAFHTFVRDTIAQHPEFISLKTQLLHINFVATTLISRADAMQQRSDSDSLHDYSIPYIGAAECFANVFGECMFGPHDGDIATQPA